MLLFWLIVGGTLLTFVFRVPSGVRPCLITLVAVVAIVAGAEAPSFD